ncbi:MAG: PH domain-containing protein [Desulfuromonadales bacterium]
MALTETTIYRQHPSWLYFSGLLVLSAVVFVMMLSAEAGGGSIVLPGVILLMAGFGRYRRLYTVTSHRIMMRTGLIANNTNEMEIRHIRGINLRQGVAERLLGIGTLEIISAADGGAEVVFSGISNPVAVKDQIRSLRPSL